jgi:hypothetical protein
LIDTKERKTKKIQADDENKVIMTGEVETREKVDFKSIYLT